MQTLTIRGTLDSLGQIREYVRTAADEAGLDKKRAYHLQLAVDEIATNIVVHGYQEAGIAGNIEIRAQLSDGALTIDLADWAAPFNPLNRPQPDQLSVSLENKPIGGLGIYLAVRNVDEFRYHWDDGRNHNIFVVRRSTAAKSEPPESRGSLPASSG